MTTVYYDNNNYHHHYYYYLILSCNRKHKIISTHLQWPLCLYMIINHCDPHTCILTSSSGVSSDEKRSLFLLIDLWRFPLVLPLLVLLLLVLSSSVGPPSSLDRLSATLLAQSTGWWWWWSQGTSLEDDTLLEET